MFEFAPDKNYTEDNSAFDVAFEVLQEDNIGLIGLECKYTDSFSAKEYDKPVYQQIFKQSNSFKVDYELLKSSRYNQLFRNQLMAEASVLDKKYSFAYTGLFCYHEDKEALEIGNEFQRMINNPEKFKIITYRNFIENVQQLPVSWQQREWSMLLWARYIALNLSKETNNQLM